MTANILATGESWFALVLSSCFRGTRGLPRGVYCVAVVADTPVCHYGYTIYYAVSISLRNFVARPSLRKRDSLFFLREDTPVYPIRLRTKYDTSTMILNIFLQKNAISVKSYLKYY